MMLKGVLVFSIIGLFCIGLVSAGVLDKIGDFFTIGEGSGEGELPAAAGARLSIGNNPPTIENWTKPEDTLGSGGYSPTCAVYGTTTTVETNAPKIGIEVVVSDPDGCWDLANNDPGGPGVVTAYIMNGSGAYRPESGGDPAPVACTTTAQVATCATTLPHNANNVTFVCPGIDMNYYDEESNDWIINISASDGSNIATNSPKVSDTLPAAGGYFSNLSYGYNICLILEDEDDTDEGVGAGYAEDTILWGSITATSVNEGADVDLTVHNRGNVYYGGAVNKIQITGSNLVAEGASGDEVNITSFFVDDADTFATCNVGLDILDTVKDISTTLDNGIDKERLLYFCIEEVDLPFGQVGLTPDDYNAVPAWDIGGCYGC
jgi:hypothetical protein